MQKKLIAQTTLKTPLGPMQAFATELGLVALEFPLEERLARVNTRLKRWFANCTLAEQMAPVFVTLQNYLDAYFQQKFLTLPEIPLDLRGTQFERSVWAELLRIPAGTTQSYGDIAQRLGLMHGGRAVGAAIGRNPVSIVVPCHRVIGLSGSLTGYGGGIERKRYLLAHERASELLFLFESPKNV